jgi:hypothetical protein
MKRINLLATTAAFMAATVLTLTAAPAAEPSVRLYDTVKPWQKQAPDTQGWEQVPEDNVAHAFKGDAAFMNDRIALVLRRGAPSAELYSFELGGTKLRATLRPAGFGEARLESFTVLENNAGAGSAEVMFDVGGKKYKATYEIKAGQPFVQSEAPETTTGLRVEAPCRFTVLPDFFADDIVVDAAELAPVLAELPSDNLILRLMPDEQAIVVTVVEKSEKDVSVWLDGVGAQRMLTASEMAYGKKGKIWVAVLTAPAIWHEVDIQRAQAGKVLPLGWTAPFAAVWRVDWRRQEGLTDSWQMLTERANGSYIKPGLFEADYGKVPKSRRRWTTVLNTFQYPAWLDKERHGYLEPLKDEPLVFEGPAVIYPLSRTAATGLNDLTPVDMIRNTLGLGPCEYVLDVEGQHYDWVGMATCGVRDTLTPIYAAHRQGLEQKKIEDTLDALIVFVKHIRARIQAYVDFGHEMRDYLETQKKAHPELTSRLTELQKLAAVIDEKFAQRKEKIQTPAHVESMVKDFRRDVLHCETEDAPAKCKEYTAAWVVIGGNQDNLAGECRWATKMLSQRAALMMAMDPRMAEVAHEIRAQSQKVLRNGAGHEGPTH